MFAEGDFEVEYCDPGDVYDPPGVLPTSATEYEPFGTHFLSKFGTDKRAGFAALLGQRGGAFATVPGNLTSAAECHTPLRSGAVSVSCGAPRYSVEKRGAVAGQYRVALNAGVIERADHNTLD